MKKRFMGAAFAAFALSALAFAACSRGLETITKGDETVTRVSSDDAAMNRIIEDARATVATFADRLAHPEADETGFQVKYPFTTDPGSDAGVEHIWIGDLAVTDGVYSGTVLNEPFWISAMKLGDVVEFDISSITDWMYYKNGRIRGGKSIKYLIESIPEDQRDEETKAMLALFD